jgi:hypothetical protein
MSLHRIAARIAAVQALKGRTLVVDNVLDSDIGALDVQADQSLRTDQEKPFISVYCDASVNKDGPASDQLRALVPNGITEFLFEAGITASMTVTDPDTDESFIVPGIPATDPAFEFHLDIVMRQLSDALTDPTNQWAEVFRKFCRSFIAIERARASGDDKGVRLAAHQLKLTVDLWPDPVRGMELKPEHPLAMFFSMAETITVSNPNRTKPNPDYPHDSDYPRIEDPDAPETVQDPVMAAKVAMMRAQLTGDEHDWQLALRRYGMTHGEADAMLLTTPEGAEADVLVVEVNTSPVVPVGG